MEFENKKHLLNYEKMDTLHKEFVDIYNSIEEGSIESYKNVMFKLIEQTKRHFCEEESLMLESEYPRKKEHMDEHNKVLAEMEYFLKVSHSKFGQSMLKSYVKNKLPYWFEYHVISMDSDLSSFLKKIKIAS